MKQTIQALRALVFCLVIAALLHLCAARFEAQVKRVVIMKVDGLPGDIVDQYVRQRSSETGKSRLPWFDYVFYQHGTRMQNFYVRGMSLSGPSWSLLDTGQHLQIKGNVEYDRFSLRAYDYLNFLPFQVNYALNKRVDMPGPEQLDEIGIPLLCDAFPYEQRYTSHQLHQRGNRWTTLSRALPTKFARPFDEIVDEWTTEGLGVRDIILSQTEHEVILHIGENELNYLDYYSTDFDHRSHHNRDAASRLAALQDLDAVVGRIWTAIERSPRAAETALVLVSDHGFNSNPAIYSQGFNLVKLLGSAGGGGHHVITKRRLMLDYSVKGVFPFVPLITNTSNESYYLKGQSTAYPTALLDFDGNERASVHLRDSDLNVIQILLQRLQSKNLQPTLDHALRAALFKIIETRRVGWSDELERIKQQMDALERWTLAHKDYPASLPKKFTQEDMDLGRDKAARRKLVELNDAQDDLLRYREYARTLTNLIELRAETFAPARMNIADFVSKGSMGNRNSVYALQNYVVGVAADGLQLSADGTLDMDKSFKRVDYFALLQTQMVRNNVQSGIGNRPIDFVAMRIDRSAIAAVLPDSMRPDDDVVWIYAGSERQALLLARHDRLTGLQLRYVPVRGLRQLSDGKIQFELANWASDFPLRIWEDPKLHLPANPDRSWLNDWHSELEWLHALHETLYSNGLIGLHEQLIHHPVEALELDQPGLTDDERTLRAFHMWKRQSAEPELLILANNHWNFDVRGFNPGGNHGSFFRISTNSTLMLAGGGKTGIPNGLTVTEPYDSLSFTPTILALMGRVDASGTPDAELQQRGFWKFPGRIIRETLGTYR